MHEERNCDGGNKCDPLNLELGRSSCRTVYPPALTRTVVPLPQSIVMTTNYSMLLFVDSLQDTTFFVKYGYDLH